MRKLNPNKYIFLLSILSVCLFTNKIAAQEDSVVIEEVVKLHYYNTNNKLQYLVLESFLKTGKKSEPQTSKSFQLYLDSTNTDNSIAKLVTNKKGIAKAIIPPSLKMKWDAASKHKFIAVAAATGKEEEKLYELEITKARITLDTISEEGARSITVHVEQYVNDEWEAAPDVEMKIGIERLGSILSAGDEETYTTDSAGNATAEFKKDSLPGDSKGNFILVAKIEDNEQYGNLLIEKSVGWGVALHPDTTFFDQRTLWTTRFRTPFWLLFMAYSIILAVWGTIIYLIIQIIKIKKIGIANA